MNIKSFNLTADLKTLKTALMDMTADLDDLYETANTYDDDEGVPEELCNRIETLKTQTEAVEHLISLFDAAYDEVEYLEVSGFNR